jgi:stage V sporulation protein S
MTYIQAVSTQNSVRPQETTANSTEVPFVIKVASSSKTTAVAGAIAGIVRQNHEAKVQAVGAAAVNQAIKAIAIAVGYLKTDGIHVICIPYFAQITIDNEDRTAMRFQIEPRM